MSATVLQVCASTSVLMILFSSSAIAISLGFQGLLNVHYAAVFAPACFLGSLLGMHDQLEDIVCMFIPFPANNPPTYLEPTSTEALKHIPANVLAAMY